MKIAFDYGFIASEFKTGMNWYAYNLIRSIAKIDGENSYLLYHFTSKKHKQEIEILKGYLPEQKNFRTKYIKLPGGIIGKCCERFLPIELFTGRTDIIHLPGPGIVVTDKAKVVVTIHDLIYFIPESSDWLPNKKRRKGSKELRASISRADRIITVSEYSKRDILKYFSFDPGKISVTHLGVDITFHPCEDKEKEKTTLEKYGISKRYLLFTGAIYPRKNLIRLVLAFKKAKRLFREYQLVIAGRPKGPLNGRFFDTLEKLPAGIRDDVILTGYVSREDLPYLYSGADLYVYPSLYEGFGLPILEAMACNCPVITSNITSMPEVAGNAAVLVDPYSVEEIASAIEKVLSDEDLRTGMRARGMARAKEFSWEKTARETLRIYEETYKQK